MGGALDFQAKEWGFVIVINVFEVFQLTFFSSFTDVPFFLLYQFVFFSVVSLFMAFIGGSKKN